MSRNKIGRYKRDYYATVLDSGSSCSYFLPLKQWLNQRHTFVISYIYLHYLLFLFSLDNPITTTFIKNICTEEKMFQHPLYFSVCIHSYYPTTTSYLEIFWIGSDFRLCNQYLWYIPTLTVFCIKPGYFSVPYPIYIGKHWQHC